MSVNEFINPLQCHRHVVVKDGIEGDESTTWQRRQDERIKLVGRFLLLLHPSPQDTASSTSPSPCCRMGEQPRIRLVGMRAGERRVNPVFSFAFR